MFLLMSPYLRGRRRGRSSPKERTFESEGEDVQPRSSVPSVLKTHCFF